ncbi:MAG: oxidoreductase [Bacteroidales bacterium]|nr:oxidoreductase [Bacteroidales bacterium]
MRASLPVISALVLAACTSAPSPKVQLSVVDPGHFHAALVQKNPLEGVCDTVKVYAPEGPEVRQYLATVASYGLPWVEETHLSEDFLEQLPPVSGPTEAVVLAGNNARKSRYILEAVKKGYNVLSDKPMALDTTDFSLLREAYSLAAEKGTVILELMTERQDPVNILTRNTIPRLGGMLEGDAQNPAIEMESIHHFYKEVSGAPLVRPVWYYDTSCQGEGIADVTTHLIDLVFWQCFPDRAVSPADVQVVEASHYPTFISPEQFFRSTRGQAFPPGLRVSEDGLLPVYSNGSITFKVNGIFVKMAVRWDFEGEPDRFSAVYHCQDGDIRILQEASTGYARKLFIRDADSTPAPGPGHEDHFSLVTGTFLKAVTSEATLPAWEAENTLAKYKVTTTAVMMAQ